MGRPGRLRKLLPKDTGGDRSALLPSPLPVEPSNTKPYDVYLAESRGGALRDAVARCRRLDESSLEAGLPTIVFHELRRTTATLLRSLSVPARDAQSILGHANITGTLCIYRRSSNRKESFLLVGDTGIEPVTSSVSSNGTPLAAW